jgi:polysaccharide export outer membrane protein
VDYPIGAGDVLEVSVPALEELTNRVVRVSGDGSMMLPMVGLVQAAGLTEQQLVAEIRRRLEANIMYDPQVHLFVREYRSRQVAVIGAVEKPGLYNLSSEAETILDLISQAGGMKNDAATRINFIAAEPVEGGQARQLASVLPVTLSTEGHAPLLLKKTDPIVIDLQTLAKGGSQMYLTLPTRPGDVIMVPGAGEVLIEGWVEKPGSYKVTPGLTVLGAVAAAGGSMFAANTGAVTVIRTSKGGEKMLLEANLDKIKHGADADIPLQEGDVIDVASSPTKVVPYGFYRLFSTVFHIGASAPLF